MSGPAGRPRPCRKLDVLGHGKVGVNLRFFGREPDAALRDPPRRKLCQIGTVKGDFPGQRTAITHDAAKRRGLAGAVTADETDEFTRCNREADAVENAAALNVDFYVGEFEHYDALLKVGGRVPTTAEIIAGSAKNRSGGMSANTRPSCRATIRCE